MEELKPVPAREILRQVNVELECLLRFVKPDSTLLTSDYELIVKAAESIKLLWEANRGY